MANIAHKPDEFEAATGVMESGLLRALRESASEATEELAPPLAPASQATAEVTMAVEAAPAPSSSRARFFTVAAIIVAIVMAFDASLLLKHRRAPRAPQVAAAVVDPMPRYMLLPPGTPPAAQPIPAPEPTAPTVLAAATPIDTPPPARAHRHSRHRHGHR